MGHPGETGTTADTAGRKRGTIGAGAAVHDVYTSPDGRIRPVCGVRMKAPLVQTGDPVTCRHCATTGLYSPGSHLVYLALSTDRVEECRAFYEGFGLVFTPQQHEDGPEHEAARFPGGPVLELYPAGGRGPSGPRRLGIALPPTGGPAESLVTRDPDGRTVEVITPGPDWVG